MATFVPGHLPQQPPTDIAPNSPPERASFYHDGRVQSAMLPYDNRDARAEYRPSLEFSRNTPAIPTNGNGPLQMPRGTHAHVPNGAGRHRSTMSMGAFDGPKSPPNTKNTSHVPCKFFRLGQCQAGKACPFSHALDSSTDEICRYFQKVFTYRSFYGTWLTD